MRHIGSFFGSHKQPPVVHTIQHANTMRELRKFSEKVLDPSSHINRNNRVVPAREHGDDHQPSEPRRSPSKTLLHRVSTLLNFPFASTRSIPTGSPAMRRVRRRDFHIDYEPSEEHQKKMRWVIRPRSTWKVRWDMWIGLIVCYSVILIPYRISFNIDLASWEQILNHIFDFSFAVDIGFNFFTGFYDGDAFVFDLPAIRWRYLRGWFFFDVLSTLPFDQFFQAVTVDDQSLLSFKLFRTIRLFRLLKLMRLLRLKRTIEMIQKDALNAHVLQTIKSLATIIFVIHVIACAWYMFYTWDPTGFNWVTSINPDGLVDPYLVSFYWVSNTIMSVGYGDIHAVTDSERIFSIFIECIGSISVGLIIANIQMLSENFNPRGAQMQLKLQEVKEFLLQRGIPRRMRQRVISQFEYFWTHRTVLDEEELLRQFPKSLQYELLAASMERFVDLFPFFGMASVDFFVFVVPKLRPIMLGSRQELVEAESVWEDIFFVISGSLEALRGHTIASVLSAGDICGAEYLVGARRRYYYTFRSTDKTELYALATADLLESMDKCSIARKYLTDLAHILSSRYADAARRGRRVLQKQETSIRRASTDLFLQARHRRSASFSLHPGEAEALRRAHQPVGDDTKLHWSIMRQYSIQRMLWDLIMAAIVAWTALSVPFRICFDIQDTRGLFVTDRLSDILFFFDIVANFITSFVDDSGVEVLDRFEIRRHYMKTSFIVDVVTTIPFDYIIELLTTSGSFKSLKLIRTIKLVKLLRLVRLSKLLKLNAQWVSELDISMDTVRLLKLLVPVLLIGHYVGCFWYYISADRPSNEAWWGRIRIDPSDHIISMYIASVYWATTTMTTVGFGDIFAMNSEERLYCIVVVIGGATLFAYVVGTVIEVVSNSKSLVHREHEMMQRVNAYIKERGVSNEFVVACQEHLNFLNSEKTLFQERTLYKTLSQSLRSELVLQLNCGVVEKIRFFDKKPKWFLTLLLPRLVPQFFLAGDVMIHHGNLVSGIFFLISGAAVARLPQIAAHSGSDRNESYTKSRAITIATNGRTMDTIPDNNGILAKMHEGEFFGYKEVLTHAPAQYNVFASCPTGIYILPSEDLDAINENYPDVLEEMRGLFLHSIHKQQTILHHWHNNEMMGISTEESDTIMRHPRTNSGDQSWRDAWMPSDRTEPSPTMDSVREQPHIGNREQAIENQPTESPIRPISSATSLDTAREPHHEIHPMSTIPRGPTQDNLLTEFNSQLGPQNPNHALPSSPPRQNPQHRRSSFAATTPVLLSHPPLQRFPSGPEDISKLVGQLLEGEGYVMPRRSSNGRNDEVL